MSSHGTHVFVKFTKVRNFNPNRLKYLSYLMKVCYFEIFYLINKNLLFSEFCDVCGIFQVFLNL